MNKLANLIFTSFLSITLQLRMNLKKNRSYSDFINLSVTLIKLSFYFVSVSVIHFYLISLSLL